MSNPLKDIEERLKNPLSQRSPLDAETAAKAAAEAKARDEAIRRVCASEDGKVFVRYLADCCGVFKADAVVDPESGELQIRSTIYNTSLRTLYLKRIRPKLSRETLIAVEIDT